MPASARHGIMRRCWSYQASKAKGSGAVRPLISNLWTFFLPKDTLRFMFMPRMLSKIVDQVARQTVGKDWNLYAALLEHWPEIVGVEYARVTTPVKMTFPHQPQEARQRNGTLCVQLPKGLSMEFTFKTEQIRQRINAYFGYDAVGKISLQPVYGAEPATPRPHSHG